MSSVGQLYRHPVRFLLIGVLLVGAFRFVSGRPMLGRRKTNSTFVHTGTKAVGEGAQMVKVATWDYYPGWKRALIRLAALAALVSGAFTYVFHHDTFIRATWVTLALVLALVGVLAWQKWQTWRHDRTYVLPLHVALRHMLSLPDTMRAEEYIAIPKTFATNEKTPARVILPKTFNPSPGHRSEVGGLFAAKLGPEGAYDITFHTMGQPSMVATIRTEPPRTVLLADVISVIDACEPGEILLGLDKRHRPRKVNFHTESPHAGFSCESGTGKSALLVCIAAQVIRQNPANRVVAIDPKISSLEALRGVPGVRIVNELPTDDGVQAMWKAVEDVADEVLWRAAIVAKDPTAEFPWLVLIVDESNLLASFSATTWERVKPKGEKGKAPIWASLQTVLAAGRQFNVTAIIVGQDLRESALGGIGLRAMLGLRGIAGYDAQMWGRFMQTRPIPRRQYGQGRWCYRIDGEDVWVQNVWAPEDPQALSDFAQGRLSHVALRGTSAGESQETGASATGSATPIVGVKAAAEWLEMTPTAFRKARERHPIDGENRRGNQPCWTQDALRSWRESTLARQP
jgi:hypothetical protein